MSFDCINSNTPMNCGEYKRQYVGNLEYVTEGLLYIINDKILTNELPGTPFDTTDDNCNCTTSEETDNRNAKVFNCVQWTQIKNDLIDINSNPNDTKGLLPILFQTIRCTLVNTPNINHAFAAQLERFLCLVESLSTRIDSVSCNNKCPEIIGDLLCLLLQILTELISAVSKLAVLIYYSGCNINASTGNKEIASLFECLLCDFINNLCELERLIPELSAIVVGFATCDMQMCTPCYTTQSTPKKLRPICPPHMMNNGGFNRPYNCGGCCCKK
ncbi:hypothetical protein EAI30_13145 [Romboutsia ilealis]|uniref:Uncharacterized protein n=1 Tax=Romboutsia faecis TaxID=2764597 RepID=A0ABR7JSW5_9FIRM|nr:hypothetical protein [Romboutsia faecis]MBC5997867.1 hypothetical protein [Romboutsia faecis]MRN25563.1 hypothetical protein [Romboutsia ilealis]